MRTIAIMNNKGGVGKTVTAINLADILVNRYKKRVVLADCDGQMNLTRFYRPKFDPVNSCTMADLLMGRGESVWSDNLEHIAPGLDLVPGSPELYALDLKAIQDGVSAPERIRDFVACAAEDQMTDFFILDCPTGFTLSSVGGLMAADEVVIPMVLDGFSFEGVYDMHRQIQNLQRANIKVRIAGVLITRRTKSDATAQAESLIRASGIPVFRQVIRRSPKVTESTFDRRATVQYSPGSAASQDYRKWVKEYLGGVLDGQ